MGNEPAKGDTGRAEGAPAEVEPRRKGGAAGRRPWESPRITCHGSTRWLIRGASGPLGDKTTVVGMRTDTP